MNILLVKFIETFHIYIIYLFIYLKVLDDAIVVKFYS